MSFPPWIASMEAELPSSWSAAGRNALANSLWILPLLAGERVLEGHFGQAGIVGIAWLVAVAVSVKLHVIQDVISSRKRRDEMLTWGLILGGAILLGIGIYRLS